MTTYINAHRERVGVEPVLRVLRFAHATHYFARSRTPSARTQRDEMWVGDIERFWTDNRKCRAPTRV